MVLPIIDPLFEHEIKNDRLPIIIPSMGSKLSKLSKLIIWNTKTPRWHKLAKNLPRSTLLPAT